MRLNTKVFYIKLKTTVWARIGHGTMDWFKIGKERIKAVHCHSAYLTYMQSTSWEMLGWINHKLESSLLREISTVSDKLIIPL